MKYAEVIASLSIEDKIAIASDVSALGQVRSEYSLPDLRLGQLDQIRSDKGYDLPSFDALGYAWNSELSQKVFAYQASVCKEQGVNIVFTPYAGVKSNPFSEGISEDPVVNRQLINRFSKAIKEAGLHSCVACGIHLDHLSDMDEEKSERAFNDYYMGAFTKTENTAFCFPYQKFSGKYAEINTKDVNQFLHRETVNQNRFVLCHDCPASYVVKALNEGNLLVGASITSIRNAVHKFDEMYAKVENGEIDVAVLDDALQSGLAISHERLDEAVDRVIDFAQGIQPIDIELLGEEERAQLSRKAVIESIVMLKHGRTLPLKEGENVLFIGSEEDDVLLTSLTKGGANGNGTDRYSVVGYQINGEPSEELLDAAVSAGQQCDVAVMLLHASTNFNQYYLPANQLELIDTFSAQGIPIVAVLCGNRVVDVGFEKQVSSLLLCPAQTTYTAEALICILNGSVSPSGKLINTFHTDSAGYFSNVNDYRLMGSAKVGMFIGYRAYESGKTLIQYPFGYGLSYTKFEYSNAVMQGSTLSFTVKNVGGMKGAEVVQIYIGKKDSSFARPAKELKSFVKISLECGQRKMISITLTREMLEISHEQEKILEGGMYQIYIGSSVSDIRLQTSIYVSGNIIDKQVERQEDYVMAHSNVLSDGYTVAPVQGRTMAGKRARIVGCVLMILSFFLESAAVVLYFMGFGRSVVGRYAIHFPMGVVWPAILAIGFIVAMIGIGIRRHAQRHLQYVSTGKAHEENTPERAQEYRDLFDSLYREEEVKAKLEKEKAATVSVAREEFTGEFNPKINFKITCGNLATFLGERGLAVDKAFARKILASFASSRVLVLTSNERSLENRLVALLAEFFNGEVFALGTEGYETPAQLLFDGNEDTPLAEAIKKSSENRDIINIATLHTKSLDQTARLLNPFTRCADRRVLSEIFLYQEGKTKRVQLPPNLWFIIYADEECDFHLTDNLMFCDMACMVNLTLMEGQSVGRPTVLPTLNFYQFLRMEQRALRFDDKHIDSFQLDEEKYLKKLDSFEEYFYKKLEENGNYSFSNKFNMSIERFITVYLACEGEDENTFDCAIAAKLTLAAFSLVELYGEGGFIGEVDEQFGEHPTEETKRMLNLYESRVAE